MYWGLGREGPCRCTSTRIQKESLAIHQGEKPSMVIESLNSDVTNSLAVRKASPAAGEAGRSGAQLPLLTFLMLCSILPLFTALVVWLCLLTLQPSVPRNSLRKAIKT